MGELQERITSTRRARSLRSRPSMSRLTTTPTRRRRRPSLTSTRRRTSPARSSSWEFTPPSIRWRRRRESSIRRSSAMSTTTGAGRQAGPAAVQGSAGHHRDSRHRRVFGRRQADRRPRPPHPAVPVAAVLRRRAVHGLRREYVTIAEPCAASARSSTASTTTCRSRRSTWSGPSRKRWKKPRR